jgi:hypothetical protein
VVNVLVVAYLIFYVQRRFRDRDADAP